MIPEEFETFDSFLENEIKLGKLAQHGECRCVCHVEGFIAMHIAPCCYPCRKCGRNIEAWLGVWHDGKCEARPE